MMGLSSSVWVLFTVSANENAHFALAVLPTQGECLTTFREPHDDRVWALAVAEDGARVATGGGDGVVRVWRDATAEHRAGEAAAKAGEELMSARERPQGRGGEWRVVSYDNTTL